MFDLSNFPWKELGLLIAGGAVTSIAYLTKRWIEGTPITDQLERRTKVLAIHTTLKSEGMTVSDLDDLEANLTRRRNETRQIEDKVASELADQRVMEVRPGETQADMSRLAAADLDISRAMLAKVLTELEMHCSDDGTALLKEAQDAWEIYAESDGRYCASHFAGGSIYPLVYLTELERLTVSRIAEVRANLQWLKTL